MTRLRTPHGVPWILFAAGLLALALPAMALGADDGAAADTSTVVFPWAEGNSVDDNFLEGLGYFGLGCLGALVTAYLFLGDFLPSMGGKADYELRQLELEELTTQRAKNMTLRDRFASGEAHPTQAQVEAAEKLTEHLSQAIDAKSKELARHRTLLFLIGIPLYVLLGGGFAVLLAGNILQAILIGFGWTAFAGRLGLSRELEQKTQVRDQEATKLIEEAERGHKVATEVANLRRENQDLKARISHMAEALAGTAHAASPAEADQPQEPTPPDPSETQQKPGAQ